MKQDALTMALLYDYYGELLTKRQRDCFDLYYNQDLSLSEIAEELGVTRQGIHDALARAQTQMQGFEMAIGCIARDRATHAAAGRIEAAAKALAAIPGAEALAGEILEALNEIKE